MLAIPAAAHAYTVTGTEYANEWWSPDSSVQFEPGEVWTLFSNGNVTQSGIGPGELRFGSLHEGLWTIQSSVSPPLQFGLDFTPPTSGDISCHLSSTGWCLGGFTLVPAPTDPFGPGAMWSSGVDYTEYSLDGGASWTAFDPFTPTHIEGDHSIEWRSVDRATNVEQPHTGELKMDTQSPSASVGIAGPTGRSGWYTGPVTVTIDPSDPSPGSGLASTQYNLTGDTGASPVADYTAPFTLSTEGDNFVNVYVKDVAGNQGYVMQAVSIDSLPPVPTLVCCSAESIYFQGWYKDGVIADVSAQDPSTGGRPSGVDHGDVGWTSSGLLGYVPINTPFTVTGDGPTTISYTAVDKAGNVAPVQTETIDIDSQPPQTQLSFNGATYDSATGWWIGAPLVFDANGTDPNGSGVATMNVCVDSSCGPYFGSHAGPFTLYNGTHTVSAVSTDNVGHVEAPSSLNRATVKVDADPPTGKLVLTGTRGDNGWYRSPVTVTIANAADAGSGLAADPFHYQLFGSTPTSFDGTYTESSEGDTAFTGEITDVAGNVTKLPQDVLIDTRPPTATLQGFEFQGAEGWDRYAEVDGLSANDPFPGSGLGKVTFSFDGDGPYTSLDQIPAFDLGDFDLPIPDGTHTLGWQVSDNAGNQTTGSKTYTVDSTPPAMTCTATTPAAWPTDGSMVPVSVDVSASDALSGLSPGGATLSQVSSNIDQDAQSAGEASGWDVGAGDTSGEVAALPGRTYELVYTEQDIAGNEGACVAQITVPGTPGPAIVKGNLTLTDGTPLTVDLERDGTGLIGGAGIAYGDRTSTGIDDLEILGKNGYISGTFDDGGEFYLLLHDGSPDQIRLFGDGIDTGWVVPASGDLRITQDTTPPVLTLPASPLAADATSAAGTTVTYTVTAKDDVDPSPTVQCAPASGTVFPIGNTTVTCTATDASGNESGGSFVVHVEGAHEQMSDLLTAVQRQQIGPGTSLAAKLRGPVTCDNLRALGNEVRAQTGKKITRQDAATIAADLARIENVLGC